MVCSSMQLKESMIKYNISLTKGEYGYKGFKSYRMYEDTWFFTGVTKSPFILQSTNSG